jgi:hypothetical protein
MEQNFKNYSIKFDHVNVIKVIDDDYMQCIRVSFLFLEASAILSLIDCRTRKEGG